MSTFNFWDLTKACKYEYAYTIIKQTVEQYSYDLIV